MYNLVLSSRIQRRMIWFFRSLSLPLFPSQRPRMSIGGRTEEMSELVG